MTDIIRTTIASGKCSIGTAQGLVGGFAAEFIGRIGFPWVLVDLQHGANELSDLLSVIQALELTGTAALVRSRSTDAAEIMRILDFGALGIIAPMVGTVEEARRVAKAVHYPPKGARSLGPLRRPYGGGQSVARPLCFVMIETLKGLENAEAIAAEDGIDGLILGPGDMALSLGVPVSPFPDPRVMEASNRLVEICRNAQKIPGAFAFSLDGAASMVKQGMQLIVFGADVLFLEESGKKYLAALSKMVDSQ